MDVHTLVPFLEKEALISLEISEERTASGQKMFPNLNLARVPFRLLARFGYNVWRSNVVSLSRKGTSACP